MSAQELYALLSLEGDSQNIRILDLHPSSVSFGSAGSPQSLEGTLRVASLRSSPHFNCLSYVWGQQASDGPTIQIAGHHIRITTNCYEALSSLLERYGAISTWVDSICIDQSNIDERGAQVAIMGKVYSQAHTMFAWLGNGSTEITAAFSWLADVAENKRRWDVKFLDESKYLNSLIRNRWFSRGWTFQELILARNPVLFTRNDILSWYTVSQATEAGPARYLNYVGSSPRNAPMEMYELASLAQTWKAAAIAGHVYGVWLPFLMNAGILIDLYLVLHRMNISWHEMFYHTPLCFLLLYLTVTVGRHIMYTFVAFLLFFFGYLAYHLLRHLIELAAAPLWHLDSLVDRYLTVTFEVWRLTFIAQIWRGAFVPTLLIAARLMFYGNILSWKTIARITMESFWAPKPCGAIIQALRHRQVQDIKDTSYSLYGVLQAFRAKLSKPDYHKSSDQIFCQLAVDLLQWSHNTLSILLDAGQSDSTISPTWVPRWKDSTCTSWIPSNVLLQGTNASAWEQLGTHGLPLNTVCSSSLFVCGVYVDRISHCIPFPARFKDEHLFPQLAAMIEPLRKQYFDFGLRMVKKDLPEKSRVSAEKDLILWDGDVGTSYFIELLMKLARCNKDSRLQEEHGSGRKDVEFAQRLSSSMADNTGDAQWFRYICNEIRDKSVLFVTESGHIGVGPMRMQPHDEVYRISGLPRPLVLRPQLDVGAFKVVGVAATSDKPTGFFWLRRMKQIRLI